MGGCGLPIGQSDGPEGITGHALNDAGENIFLVGFAERSNATVLTHNVGALVKDNLRGSFGEESEATSRERQNGRHALTSRVEREHFNKALCGVVRSDSVVIDTLKCE